MRNNKRFLQAVYNQPLLITDSEVGLLHVAIQSAISEKTQDEAAEEKAVSDYLDIEIFGATTSGKKRKEMYMGAGVSVYGEVKDEASDIIENGIAIVNIRGMITDTYMWYYETTSPRRLINTLKMLGEDPRVLGVMLNVDSGGGTVPGVLEASDLIRNYYRTYGKRIQASVERAGSAAYWMISGADKISLTNATASAGSIGTMTTFTNSEKMMESFGIVSSNVYATLSTLKNADYEQALKGNFKPVIEGMLDPLNTEFIRSVSKGRYGSRYSPEDMLAGTEETPDFLRGKMYYGWAAREVGLVDSVNTMSSMLSLFYDAATKVTDPKDEPNDDPDMPQEQIIISKPNKPTEVVYTKQAEPETTIKPLKRISDIFKTNH